MSDVTKGRIINILEIQSESGIPKGYEQIPDINGVFVGKGEIVVTGIPPAEEGNDDDMLKHNCDEMGCSSVGHVVFRAQINDARYGYKEE